MNSKVTQFDNIFIPIAHKYSLPISLVAAVIDAESAGNSKVTSPHPANARGLMQLTDPISETYGVNDPYDPEQNIEAGCHYLYDLFNQFGVFELAVAAYNAGPNAVVRYNGIPPYSETTSYVYNVGRFMLQYLTYDIPNLYTFSTFNQYSPLTHTWREAADNLKGVSDKVQNRIREFIDINKDVV